MSYLIRDAFPFLFFMGVGVNDLVPQRTQSHVGSLDRNRGGLVKGRINAVLSKLTLKHVPWVTSQQRPTLQTVFGQEMSIY